MFAPPVSKTSSAFTDRVRARPQRRPPARSESPKSVRFGLDEAMRGSVRHPAAAPPQRIILGHPGDVAEQDTVRASAQLARPSGRDSIPTPPAIREALGLPAGRLEPKLRDEMERRFGTDLSHVRIHSGAAAARSADSVGARAYTLGSSIVLGKGETTADRHLLAHEIGHVVQDDPATLRRWPQFTPPSSAATSTATTARSLEASAERIAQLIFGPAFQAGEFGAGKVLTVVMDDAGGIHAGLNTGTPAKLTSPVAENLAAHQQWLKTGPVLQETSELALAGGHAEVNALNRAIAAREVELGRKLLPHELAKFRIHNIWLTGPREGYVAPRCEHCVRLTRGIPVTESVMRIEQLGRASAIVPEARVASGVIDSGRKSLFSTAGLATTESKALTASVKATTLAAKEAEALAGASRAGLFMGVRARFLLGSFEAVMMIADVFIAFFGTLAEGRRKLHDDSYLLGFSYGIAAGLLGFTGDEVIDMLGNRSVDSIAVRVAGWEGVANRGHWNGVRGGWAFYRRMKAGERNEFLKLGIAGIKAKGHRIGSTTEPVFNLDDLVEMALAVRPVLVEMIGAAAAEEARRRREAEAKRNLEFMEASWRFSSK